MKLVILEGVDKDKCVINSALGLVCFVPIWTNWNGCLSVSALWLCPGCLWCCAACCVVLVVGSLRRCVGGDLDKVRESSGRWGWWFGLVLAWLLRG